MSRFKIRKRLNKTRLKAFEKADWVVGSSVYSARTAAVDIANALEDYACNDYKCLTLDCIASCCDLGATGIAFLPKNNITGAAFAGCTAASKFSRTLRNKCKEITVVYLAVKTNFHFIL